MRHVGVEHGYLSRAKYQVMVSENKAHAARKDIKPFVAVVGLQGRLGFGRRDDDLPRMRAPRLPGQRNDGAALRVSGLGADTRITNFRRTDELIQWYVVRLRQRQEQFQAWAPLSRLQPGQCAFRNTRGCRETGQSNTAQHTQALEPRSHLIKR